MPRFKINSEDISENLVRIEGDNYRHIALVLRMKVDDNVMLFDSDGVEYDCVIKRISKNDLLAEIVNNNKINRESPIKTTLFQAIIKGDRMDLIIQKATELGVNSIYPIVTDRSDVKNTNKIQRWQKIADESIKQCGRAVSPKVHSEIKFKQVFELEKSDLNLIFYEIENSLTITDIRSSSKIESASLIIGPEGGFTENEVALAEDNNFKSVGIGPRILRSETASIAAITLIQHYFGDI